MTLGVAIETEERRRRHGGVTFDIETASIMFDSLHSAPAASLALRAASRAALCAVLLAGASEVVRAEGLYAGGNVGAHQWSSSVNGVDGSHDGLAGKVFGGYELPSGFAIEGGATRLGGERDSLGATASGSAVFLDGVGRFEYAPKWSMLGRLGIARARFSTSGGNDWSNGLKIGAGIEHELSPTLALRVEYEYYRFADAFDRRLGIGQLTAGIKLSF
jgi:opacity protein-like surface antigen